MAQDRIYALCTPKGNPVACTASVNLDNAQEAAFGWLYLRKAWAKPYWKQWQGFIRERTRRGWTIEEFHLERASSPRGSVEKFNVES